MVKTCVICCEDDQACSFRHACPQCSLDVCDECFCQWTSENIRTQIHDGQLTWKCPSENCPPVPVSTFIQCIAQTETASEAQEQAKRKLLDLAADLSFRHFARSCPDVRMCPTKDCTYMGWMLPSELRKCSSPIVCPTCDHTWLEAVQQRSWIKSPYSGLASNLRQVLFTSPCPSCGLKIQKNKGCTHMRCAKCDFEFCWLCLTQYTSYQHKYASACFLISLAKFLIYTSLVFMVANKLGLTDLVLYAAEVAWLLACFVTSWVWYLSYYALQLVGTFLFFVSTAGAFKGMRGLYARRCHIVFLSILVLLHYICLVFLSVKSDFFYAIWQLVLIPAPFFIPYQIISTIVARRKISSTKKRY